MHLAVFFAFFLLKCRFNDNCLLSMVETWRECHKHKMHLIGYVWQSLLTKTT